MDGMMILPAEPTQRRLQQVRIIPGGQSAEAGAHACAEIGAMQTIALRGAGSATVSRRRRFGFMRDRIAVGDAALDDWTPADLAEWEAGHAKDPLR